MQRPRRFRIDPVGFASGFAAGSGSIAALVAIIILAERVLRGDCGDEDVGQRGEVPLAPAPAPTRVPATSRRIGRPYPLPPLITLTAEEEAEEEALLLELDKLAEPTPLKSDVQDAEAFKALEATVNAGEDAGEDAEEDAEEDAAVTAGTPVAVKPGSSSPWNLRGLFRRLANPLGTSDTSSGAAASSPPPDVVGAKQALRGQLVNTKDSLLGTQRAIRKLDAGPAGKSHRARLLIARRRRALVKHEARLQRWITRLESKLEAIESLEAAAKQKTALEETIAKRRKQAST